MNTFSETTSPYFGGTISHFMATDIYGGLPTVSTTISSIFSEEDDNTMDFIGVFV